MFKSYIKIAWRNLTKDLRFTTLNLVGLSTGLACALLIFLWVNDELHMDRFYKKEDRLYEVLENRKQASGIWTAHTNSGAMGWALVKEMPEVENMVVTVNDEKAQLSVGNEKNIRADGLYASRDFFKVFSYDLIQGDAEHVLADGYAIVITDELASQLFGSPENAMGKTVTFQHQKQFHVAGVYKKPGTNSSLKMSFLLPLDVLKDTEPELYEWGSTFPYTYLILKEGTSVPAFNAKIADIVRRHTSNQIIHRTPFIMRYADLYLHGRFEDGLVAGGRIEYVHLFSIIAIVILLIACINFMNLSTAKAAGRAKEVGIKKVVGAGRGSLILQYFGESMMMAFASVLLAILLVQLLLPAFNNITDKQLSLSNPSIALVISVIGITIFTGILAGSYPALYLSAFKPVSVLKGRLKNSASELFVRKGLIVFQFALSVILIVAVLAVYQQIRFIQTKSLGYDRDHILTFFKEGKLDSLQQAETFLSEIRRIPGVQHASCIGHTLTGHASGTYGVLWEGRDPNDKTEFEHVPVDYDMLETLGITMKEGRSFSQTYGSDTSKVIFNQAAIKYMGFKDPIGKIVTIWGSKLEIVGVANDFHFQSLHEKIKPLFFRLEPNNAYRYMIKIRTGMETPVISKLQDLYRSFNPAFSLDYTFLDTNYQDQYTAEKRVSVLSRYFAGLAILISCLGLFGLAAFTIQRRNREIGIRKVLGASVGNVVVLLSRDYLLLILLAALIAFPISWWAVNQWLNGFAYHIHPGVGMFLLAGVLVVMLTLITVSFQSIKAALANPAKSLKTE